jgi:hypothetical protein
MTEKLTEEEKESKPEKLFKLGRNVNALGAAAIAGVAILIPGPNVILIGWAGLNAAQAGGFEILRKNSETKRKKKKSTK